MRILLDILVVLEVVLFFVNWAEFVEKRGKD